MSRDVLKLVDLLPSEYNPRIKGMELINQPNQQFCDIGGLDDQIQEMIEAVVYPITRKEYFERSKRHNSDRGSDHEVHRTMLELLTQMDDFKVDENIRVIAATNRPDILDLALTKSGHFDRKVELPLSNEKVRVHIMQIYAQKMNVSPNVNFEELAHCTDDGAS
ncbi:26S protease regulatory subunit 6A [Trichinella pseudospiralis]|uniref:26S protease regulatory subunit 6A n=1 Tax=Trichinella pseudospiralis TaxID=6337 RepID=A0A0V1HG34_TRIPS|nr:26S protease regulatory subunit 6A [Trichinella pseudospiralis]KRZ09042.1 26S protease regulatory subunit 6A [Trichinella pseudospiralis]